MGPFQPVFLTVLWQAQQQAWTGTQPTGRPNDKHSHSLHQVYVLELLFEV